MAYRVTTEPVNRAVSAVSKRRPDNTFNRNVAIAGAALGCVCLIAAGVAVLGRAHDVGSLPDYVASHKSAKSALKIAWVEPEQQAQFERNPNIAATSTPPEEPIETASRFDTAFALLGDNAPAIPPAQVPLPHARSRKQMVAAIPLPHERTDHKNTLAESPAPNAVTASLDEATPAANAADVSSPATAEETSALAALEESQPAPVMTLMSYAPPTREQLFAPEVTGSIGRSLRDLANASAHAVVAPVKAPHDKLLAKVAPMPVAKPPHKPTVAEKLWGPVQIASLTPLDGLDRDNSGVPHPPFDRKTAVYVITDKKVYLPDGAVLEAHSGLGDKMDDPRFANVRMRGVTPPHIYDLKLRERLFHGVEAIRMLPVGGQEAIFGRDGILAHSYMLGSSGQSNGCVSFKDYDTFLKAFKAGKIDRLAVIARLN